MFSDGLSVPMVKKNIFVFNFHAMILSRFLQANNKISVLQHDNTPLLHNIERFYDLDKP